ncbi:MAG: (4Fe-4S)-binding protein [Maribacter sp.]
MEREVIKEYQKGELTIVWKPKTCIHSGICVKTLPKVYDPKAKPWIKPENASIDALKSQIDKCPSGALSYYIKNESKSNEMAEKETKITVKPNGPLLVQGSCLITDQNGIEHKKDKITAFCRCGASKNKPFCDGEHNKIGFRG